VTDTHADCSALLGGDSGGKRGGGNFTRLGDGDSLRVEGREGEEELGDLCLVSQYRVWSGCRRSEMRGKADRMIVK
jgi:hypothetical protein